MMLQVFNFDEATAIRTIERNGAIWFLAKDISDALGYSDAQAMTRKLDADEQTKANLQNVGLHNNQLLINESGLYSSILSSSKAEAKVFRKWVTSEVLPTIRKTGAYRAEQPTDPLQERRLRLDEARLQKQYLDMMLTQFANLSDNAKQVLAVKAAETAFGEKLPFLLPPVVQHLMSATEVGEKLGLTANKVGRITNELGLKTERYAECRLSKSTHSNRQVESWFYKPEALGRIKEYLKLGE